MVSDFAKIIDEIIEAETLSRKRKSPKEGDASSTLADSSAEIRTSTARGQRDYSTKDWRTDAETRLKRKLDAFFKKMNDRIAGFLSTSPAWSDIPEAFWDEVQLGTLDILLPEMRQLALEGAERLGSKLPMAVNWELVNQRAVDAATNYAYNRVTGVTETGRNILQESISDFFARDGRMKTW